MKTNNQLIKEIRSGKDVKQVLADHRFECTCDIKSYKDAFWQGVLEAQLGLAFERIIELEDKLNSKP